MSEGGTRHFRAGKLKSQRSSFRAPGWEAPLENEKREPTPLSTCSGRTEQVTYTCVVTSQEYCGGLCYCHIAESSPADKNDSMRKGHAYKPDQFPRDSQGALSVKGLRRPEKQKRKLVYGGLLQAFPNV